MMMGNTGCSRPFDLTFRILATISVLLFCVRASKTMAQEQQVFLGPTDDKEFWHVEVSEEWDVR
jgi:hypothetical protein